MGHWHAHHHFVIDGVPIFCSSPWRDNDWGAGTNRIRTISWDNGKITSKVVPLWGDFKAVSFGSKTTSPPRDEWSSFAGPDGARCADVKLSLPLKPVWTRKIGGIQPYFSSPAINNGKIFLAVSDTQAGFKNSGVVCLDGGNGEVVWKTSIPSDCYSSVVLSDGKVFAANAVGQVYALSQSDGKVLWNKSMYEETDFFNRVAHQSLSKYGWRIVFAPLAADNGKVFVSGINSFAAFDQNSGKRIWFHAGLGDMTYPVAGLAAGDGKLFGEDQSKVFALNSTDGNQIWMKKFQEMVGKMRRERGCATPTFHKGNIYFVSRSRIRKISIDGKEIWNRTLSSPINYMGSAAVADGIVVLASGNRILAVNDSKGEIVWKMNSRLAKSAGFPRYQEIRNGSTPAIADGKVFCGSDDGYVYILDLKTGEKLQEIKIGCPIKSSVAISRNYLCVSDFNGNLHALASSSK
jgi:outer membrane protein assembly factor BamB